MIETCFWLCVVAYGAHIMEEYTLGWLDWAKSVSKMEIEEKDFLLANAMVIVSGICLATIGEKNLTVSLCFPVLMLVNSLVHLIPTLAFRRYSPGLITSLAFFIPLPLAMLWDLLKAGRIGWDQLLVSLAGASAMMLYPVLLQKMKMGRKRNNIGT